MDLVSIATGAVAALSPYFGTFADKSAEALGKKAPAAVESLFHYLKEKFKSHPSASDALDDLSKAPTDLDRLAALRRQIVKVMEQDASFTRDLSDMVGNLLSNNSNVVLAGDNAKIAQQVGRGNTANIK
jgi:hypothetical protein